MARQCFWTMPCKRESGFRYFGFEGRPETIETESIQDFSGLHNSPTSRRTSAGRKGFSRIGRFACAKNSPAAAPSVSVTKAMRWRKVLTEPATRQAR